MLPLHRMQARLDFDTQHSPQDLPPIRMFIEPMHSPGPGVDSRDNGVRITGPGLLLVQGKVGIDEDWLDPLSQVPAISARCSFTVAGTSRTLELGATLHRTTPALARGATHWEFTEPIDDPWAAETDEVP
jgi:hypothetical protein